MEGIFQNGMTIAEAKPYGDVVCFNGKISEVFFTFKYKIVFKKELDWKLYFLALGCEDIHPLHLNCGDHSFLFQI